MRETSMELKGFVKWCDRAASIVNWPVKAACVFFAGAMTTVVILGVVARYVMLNPLSWTEEVARYLLVWLAIVGVPIVTRRRAHIGISYFVTKLPLLLQRLTKFATDGAIMVFLYYLTVYGIKMVAAAKTQTEPATGITMDYLLLCVPICGVLTMFQLAVQIISDFSLWGTDISPYKAQILD
jgi:TRAP-type C4-dicarboxylate transport system permease small subunit